jgi:hypothetical protein
MKASCVAVLCSLVMTSASVAASITVSDTSVPLAGVAAATTSLLLDGKFHLHNSGSGKFYVEVKKLHCNRRSNGPLDASNPHAGLPMLKCRFNAKNQRDTTSGRRFGEARATTDILQKVQDSPASAVAFSDCAAGGYCGIFAKSIRCIIDTAIDNLNNGGRWACTYVDGQ